MAKNGVFRDIFKVGPFRESFRIAAQGIVYLFLYHRNMRIIFLFGIAAFLAGLHFKLSAIELTVLCATITLVFMAEIFNTAVELMMDMLTKEYHTKIRLIKDIAAGIVVIAALNSLAVGYLLFAKKIFR